MAISRRTTDGNGGGSDAAPTRLRIKKRPVSLKPIGQAALKKEKRGIAKRSQDRPLPGELGELVARWNEAAPGTIRKLKTTVSYGRVPTDILSLDICLVGGFKRSRACMLYGERSSGKSTLCGKAIASIQRQEKDTFQVYIDVEGTVDKNWFETLGCDPDRIIVVEPETGEDAIDQTDAVLRTEHVSLVAIDSIAMITPFKEIDSSAEDQQIGLQARLIGKGLRRFQNAILQERRREHWPILMMLNQFRMKAGLAFGDPRTVPGGKAVEFITSQQCETRNKEHKQDKTGIVDYNEHTVIITKDKTGGRFKEAKFKLIRDDEATGLPVGYIDQAESIKEYGALSGILEVRGATIDTNAFGTHKSINAFREYLLENPEVERHMCVEIVEFYRNKWRIEE